jgi:fermentation-respiration switch protein FrsA (DUF1100 family)
VGVGLALLAAGLAVAAPPVASAVPDDLFGGTVAEFYEVPSPLPPGEPGEIIRVQLVSQSGGATTLRIMYHSRDAADRDRAVTGIVTYPDAPPPIGGWPVLAQANGTVGLASPCALSRNGNPAPTFGIQGVGVVTDYVGLGPVGEIHPYLSRPSEAHSVADAVRAARNITETGAGTRWLTVGGSQGGHASIATNELAASYAPELELLGAVALAPGAVFERSYGGIDEIVGRVVGVMMLYGAATEHPEIVPTDYMGPQTAAAAATVFPTQCLGAIIATFAPIPADTYWSNDPRTTEPARSVLATNDVGFVAAPTPLLVVSGTADTTVVIERARDLFARLCETGQTTEYTEYEGATHDDIGAHAATQVLGWIADRFAGVPAANSCPTSEPPPTEPPASEPPPAEPPAASPAPLVGADAAGSAAQPASVAPRFTG